MIRPGIFRRHPTTQINFVKTVRESIGAVSNARACTGIARLLLSALLVGPSSLLAQLVPDGGTRTLANVTNTITGTVTVGTNGSFTRLTLGDNALLTNSAHGVIGRNATAQSNEVQVLGASARWLMGNHLFVGSNGAFNRLVIGGGAFVNNNFAFLGTSTSASNNVVLVTGGGSLWTNRSILTVGVSAPGNQLIISNGARVASIGGVIGWQAGSSNSQAVVTGSGSTWNSDVSVGGVEHGNRMVIEAGGRVAGNISYVGDSIGERTEALVTGVGSLWSNRTELTVGLNSANNRLVVSNGASVVVVNKGRLGAVTGATNNMVLVTGAGSLWNNQSELYVGETGPRNRMELSNGGLVVSSNTVLGVLSVSTNNLLRVSGAGSVWTNRGPFTVGQQSRANRLELRDGGRLYLTSGDVGKSLGSDGNEVSIADGGSLLDVGFFVFGDFGAANRLRITGGGSLKSSLAAIGRNGPGLNNEVSIGDPGSSWNCDLLYLGSSGSGVLLLTNGGTFRSPNADTLAGPQGIIMGFSPESANNRIVVEGGTLRAANVRGDSTLDIRGGTNVLNTGLVDVDRLVLTNRGAATAFPVFVNGNFNLVPFEQALPSLYPSTIAVTGLLGRVTKVSVTLSNFYCGVPSSLLNVLLVSPTGKQVMLMSDAGQTILSHANLTLDDSATTLIPNTLTPIASGTYRPTDYEPGDILPAPAPTGPYSPSLSAFNGAEANGLWSLYFHTKTGVSKDIFMGGWRLNITTDEVPLVGSPRFELNGGTLITRGAVISNGVQFVVGGSGRVPARWEARAGLTDTFVARDLLVGKNSSFNQLVVPSGVVIANQNVVVGSLTGNSSNNLLHVTGGTLRVLSPGRILDVRGGTNRIDAGLVDVNRLVVTNTQGQFEMFGGTLRTPATTIDNGRVCIIGGGTSQATYQMLGGTHTFANNLTIATNGSLIGTGFMEGTVTVSPGGRLTPGSPIGILDVDGSVILQGTVNLQIDKSGGVRTSDEVSASGAIFYDGTLNMTAIGTDVLSAGDRFFLFTATPYVGAFTTLNLPPLASGLSWRNNLSVDGSIEVTTAVVSTPGFSAINRTGTNVVFSGTNGTPGANYTVLTATNVALPLSNWVSLVTNQFNAGGGFFFTNRIVPAESQRFFQLRTP